MDHVAIMKQSWGLLPKILDGTKTIESRWYLNRSAPWGRIAGDETIYFKDSGRPISVRARVAKVLSLDSLTPAMVQEVLHSYGKLDGLSQSEIPHYYELFKDKNYCLLIFLEDPRAVAPFEIDKSGFGAMAAWLCVDSIENIKLS